MYTPAGRSGASLLVVILLLISILLEQWIARLCPWLGEMGGIRPMIVFLDIPLRAPVTVDWIPVGFVFIFFYTIVTSSRGETGAKAERRKRSLAIFVRWWLLLICLLAGGAVFSLVGDYLPKQIRNGIDSFGVRADLTLPYPSEETIHLQGGMIMLVFFIIGWRLLVKKIAIPATILPPAAPSPASEPLSGGGRITRRIPEPVEMRNTGPRPCAPITMPETPNRKSGIFPCIVDGEIKPAVFRKKELLQ